MKTTYLFLFVCLCLSVSCKKGPPAPKTVETVRLNFSPPPFSLTTGSARFSANIPYGTDPLQTFDVFLPAGSAPTGLVVYIHGGGFASGEKESFYQSAADRSAINTYLQHGAAVASINYRLLTDGDRDGVLKPLNDGKRCLQFIRLHAAAFNVNKAKVVLTGNSAGAGMALWLAFRSEMADAQSSDPVLKESTRVTGVAANETQSTYDILQWGTDVFAAYPLSVDSLLAVPNVRDKLLAFYGISRVDSLQSPSVAQYRASVDMLSHMTADDPEFYVRNDNQNVVPPTYLGLLYHHAYHARSLQRRAAAVGLANVAYYGKNPLLYAAPSGETEIGFVLRKLR